MLIISNTTWPTLLSGPVSSASGLDGAYGEAKKPVRMAAAAWARWEHGAGRHGVVQVAARRGTGVSRMLLRTEKEQA